MLVSREWFDESQLIVVANGSFLLNLPLVNHEHRKLAGKLIDAVGPPGQTVVFLESFAGGPPISDDPSGGMPTGAEIFNALADQLDPAAPGGRRHPVLFLAVSDLRPPRDARAARPLRLRPPHRRHGRVARS